MKNKIVTHFYVREEKKDKKGEVPIYLRITINEERASLSTDRRVNPELWDKAAEGVAGRSEIARVINTSLNNLLSKVEKYFGNLDVKDELVSVHQIIAELKGKGINQMTVIKAYEYQIKKMEELSGIDYAITTINKYRYSLNSLKRFLKTEFNKTDIRLCDLDYRFIERYHKYLRTSENLMHNSAVKNIKNLFRIINISITNKWININPFKSFSCNFIDANRGYLTEEEIEALYKKEFAIKRLAKVRDVFIFQIYTGLSYCDLARLTDDSIEIGIEGKRWIVLNRKKTGTRSSIPILPRAQEVLDNYKTDPLCISDHKLLPVCTNQRMNGYLKEIADLCEIKKTLTITKS